ncbi:hypothetical protein F53441_6367 [Fusarium austroafricanum]|uniref:Uncharacterized protein n=1 Tax=Fusarium austroafricanum TaxID=2364996 RepID=A0A8H4P746_9HYPO|nr:hypothetical protein F53441_6367 [Fusarium austroafricanum]
MKYLFHLAVAAGLAKASANSHIPRQTQAPALKLRAEEFFYYLQPQDRAQIRLNPPPPDRVRGTIGVWTQYLTEEKGTTSWIGPDPSYISVETTTTKNSEGAEVTGTVNKAVDVVKHANGGLDMILSPAFREKVEAILKEVPPCTKKKIRRRQAASCGIEAAARRVMEDEGIADVFSEQVYEEISEDAGLDLNSDSGYGSDSDGFVEGAEGPPGSEAGETVEALVLGPEADAAAIAAAVGEMDTAITVGGITLTAVTFLGILLKAADTNGKIEPVYHIPPEDIQTVSKTKTKSETSTTTTAKSCPTGLPDCEDGCKATKVKDAKPTDIVQWACSEGKTKDCRCNPKVGESIHPYDLEFDNMIRAALGRLDKPDEPDKPEEPKITCPNQFSNAPSQFFGKIADGFCGYIKDNMDQENKNLPFDIYGGKIAPKLVRRAPPEKEEYYKDYVFFVSWIPKEGECLMNKDSMCTEAFKKLVNSQPCGQNHGSAGNRMTVDAKIDVGCGEFTWKVQAPEDSKPEEPSLGKQECYDSHKHTDVQSGVQEAWSRDGCRWMAEGKKMKAGDEIVYWGPPGVTGHAHMNYKISWKDGCDTFKEQSLDEPVKGETCRNIMRANYLSCNNGGAGGYRDAGCLRYEFYVK